jgi:hypothetical protein
VGVVGILVSTEFAATTNLWILVDVEPHGEGRGKGK